jgi:hypothetical protein
MPTIREKILRQEIARLRDELEGLRQEISRLQGASTSYFTSPDHATMMLRVKELYWNGMFPLFRCTRMLMAGGADTPSSWR